MAIAVGIVLLALGGVSFAAYRYDRASADQILPGVTVAGTDVGGMTRVEAIQAVQRAVQQQLTQPITIRAADGSWKTTPAELGRSADIDAAVDRALQASDSVGFITRVWHRLREEPVDISVDVPLVGGETGVSALVTTHRRRRGPDAAGRIGRRRRRRGDVRPLAAGTRARHPRRGEALCKRHWRKARPPSGCRSRSSGRKVPDSKLGKTIVVDRTINQLSLYNGFDLEKTYPVATAAAGYVTPPGQWTIIAKAENPTWTNPAPDTWGADLPAFIPPGPGNPLGTRALYLNAPGIRIHGTEDVSSIGTHASHGCIRMLMSDVEQIYPLVPIGTRVIVF